MIKESDREICFEAGLHIANLCIYGTDNNKDFFKLTSSLTDNKRKRILSEVIYFRIFLAYNKLIKLPLDKRVFILKALQLSLAQQLGEGYCKGVPYKIAEYKELDLGEFIFDDIVQNSGVRIKDISLDAYCELRFSWLPPEVAKFSQTVEKILQYVIIVSKQQSQKVSADKAPADSAKVKKDRTVNPDKSGNSKPILPILVAALLAINLAIFLLGAYLGAFDSLMVNRLAKSPTKVSEPVKPLDEPAQQELQPEEPPLEELESEELPSEELIEEIPEEPPEEPEPTPLAKKKVIPIAKGGVYTGYDPTQEILNNDGLCEFTVDNTRNDMPVYVRIWDIKLKQPVRAFTIAQGEKFTALKLSPSTYEVRYIELYENDIPPFGAKSEPFTLEQRETFTGTTYSVMELTLYKVYNGNTRTYSIPADDV